jgi:hypothetical protein
MDKKFYMIKIWDLVIKEIEIKKVTEYYYVDKSGRKFSKMSKDEILGETIEEAKTKAVELILSDIHNLEGRIKYLNDKIDTISKLELEEK